ncbi:MAG: hypothetical protein Q8P20_06370 [bacterium]|nr:hypothetical protein [bacterium]
MHLIQCDNLNHQGNAAIYTVYCVDCGERVGPHIKPNPKCINHHQEYADLKHLFCPDCGIPLELKQGLTAYGRSVILSALHNQDDFTYIPEVIIDTLFKQNSFDPEKNHEFIVELHFWGFHQTAQMLKQLMVAEK